MRQTKLKMIISITYLFILSCNTTVWTLQLKFIELAERLVQTEHIGHMINAWLQVSVLTGMVITAIKFPKGHPYEWIIFLFSSWILIPNSLYNSLSSKYCMDDHYWLGLIPLGIFMLSFLAYSNQLYKRYFLGN